MNQRACPASVLILFFFSSRQGRTLGPGLELRMARLTRQDGLRWSCGWSIRPGGSGRLFEEAQLAFARPVPRNAPISVAGPVGEARIARAEFCFGLRPAAGKPLAPPDFIEPSGIALIPAGEHLQGNPQPARDPDCDGVSFPQTCRLAVRGYLTGHGSQQVGVGAVRHIGL